MLIEGKNVLVLGGAGMVGSSVCRHILEHRPALLAVAARRESKALHVVEELRRACPALAETIRPVWGDIFLRADWQEGEPDARTGAMSDPDKRRRLIADVLSPLDDDILGASLLARMILGNTGELDGARADIVIDCMNTATAVSYQNVYSLSQRLTGLIQSGKDDTDWPTEVEGLLASLSVPQLVRHVQLLYEAMHRANTEAYIKVGTTGTGGMGFNIPFTHSEEKPSRLLLTKAALAGAQTLLTFLMARTPNAPPLVREIKPSALIGWHAIRHGPIRRRGQDCPLYDCLPENAVPVSEPASLASEGDFGFATAGCLEGVYIDTGENGLFTADEFAAISNLGLMQLVTPEEVAENVVRELTGASTGHDVIAALDGAVTGPSFRGGFLREAALNRLRQLEAKHGQAVAFELLGPPRLSKLLFEAYLLKTAMGSMDAVIAASAHELSAALSERIAEDTDCRRRMLSIGIPVLLGNGERLLRGPVIKSVDADHGWVDLSPANMDKWRERLSAIGDVASAECSGDTSSMNQRIFSASRGWQPGEDFFDLGEIVSWIFIHEDGGRREKN